MSTMPLPEQAWQEFVKDPGPIVVGAVQGIVLAPRTSSR